MMILKKRKVKPANEDSIPNSTSVIYLTAVKVSQCRQVDMNRRETKEAKKITAKNTATRKVHLQLKTSEAFDRGINSITSLYSYTTDE